MRQTLRLGHISGVSIGVHWSVLVIMVLLAQGLALSILPASSPGLSGATYWSVAAAISVVFLVSLLAHEMAHALVARHYGVRVRRVTLWLLGGVAELEGEAPHARADLLIALVGPLTSLASGVVFGALAFGVGAGGGPRLATAALIWLAAVNGLLAVFNMLPGAPLDGGRVLRAIIWRIRGDRVTAQRAAANAGVGLGVLIGAAGLVEMFVTGTFGGLWLVLLGWFLVAAASAERNQGGLQSSLGSTQVGEVMSTNPVTGYTGQSIESFVQGVARHRPYRTYPVLDLDGRLAGVVNLARLNRVPQPRRAEARLADVLVPAERTAVLHPDTLLAEAAGAVLAGPGKLAPVTEDGRLVGVLSSGDVSRAIELGTLGVAPSRPDADDLYPPSGPSTDEVKHFRY